MGNYAKQIPFILSLILLVSISYADYSSFLDNYGISDPGNIDSTAGDWTESTRLLSDGVGMPLVADLDGDRSKEVIVFDGGDTVNLFKSVNGVLNLVRIYQDPSGFGGDIQYAQIVDIDADGLKEVVFIDNKNIYIVEYDGDDLTLQNKMEFNASGKQAIFSCQFANRCVLVWTERSTFTASTSSVFARTFTSTQLNDIETLETSDGLGSNYYAYCMPELRSVYWGDVWDNGEDYAVFTLARIRPGTTSDDRIQVHTIHLNASNDIDDEQRISWTRAGTSFYGYDLRLYTGDRFGSCVSQPVGQRFTPVLPYNFYPASDTLELGYSIMLDSDEDYILDIKDSTGSTVRRFPQVQNQEGLLISNVFLGNIFPDQDNRDLCVFGYNDDDNILKLLCGRTDTIDDDDTRELYLNLDDYPELDYLIPSGDLNYMRSVHSGQHKFQVIDDDDDNPGMDPYEIITPYGLLAVDPDEWVGFIATAVPKDGELYPALTFNNEPGVMLGVKTKTVDISDYLFMTNSSLTLLDNGKENTPAWISKVSFNPCLNDDEGNPVAWKQGTDAIISVTPEDNDEDQVRARVILYYGEDPIEYGDVTVYDSDDEPLGDSVYEGDEEGIGGDSTTEVYEAAFLLRSVPVDNDFGGLTLGFKNPTGTPSDNNYKFNVSICPTLINTFVGVNPIFHNCVTPPQVVAVDVPLSTLVGAGNTVVDIHFNNSYTPDLSYDDYIVGFTYSSGTIANENWKVSTDNAVTNNLIKITRKVWSTQTVNQVNAKDEVADISLYYRNISGGERVSEWSDYVTHNNKIPISFTDIDQLTSSSKIRVEVNDIENPGEIDSKSYNFFVEVNGVIQGECVEDFSYTDPNIEPDTTPCVTTADCSGSQTCQAGICVDQSVEDLADILLPPDSIPTAWRPIIGLIAIIIIIGGTLLTLKEMGIDHERVYIISALSVAIVLWILLVYISIIPGWTLLVGLVTGAALIGFLFYSKHKGG